MSEAPPEQQSQKALVLARVSSRKQEREGQSLDVQVARCEAVCEREGIQVLETVKITKNSLSAGPDVLSAIIRAMNMGANVVMVSDLDRLSREPYILFLWEKVLHQLGMKLMSAHGKLDTSQETGFYAFSFSVLTASAEKRRIANRAKIGGRARAKAGAWRGGKPVYGYNHTPGDQYLTINKEEAQTVDRLFREYAKCKSLIGAIRKVNWMKPDGSGLRNSASLSAILKNPRYVGRARYKDVELLRAEERIVSDRLYNKVQRILVEKTHERKGKQREVGIEPASYLVALGVLCRAFDDKQVFALYNQLFNDTQAHEGTEASETGSEGCENAS